MSDTMLVLSDGETYVVDLSKNKPKTIKDILTTVDDTEGVFIVSLDDQEPRNLTDILMSGVNLSTAARSPYQSPVSPRRDTGGAENAKIREWARAEGIEIASRGRISEEIKERYYAEKPE